MSILGDFARCVASFVADNRIRSIWCIFSKLRLFTHFYFNFKEDAYDK